jgi:sugar phosphate isomerase/epimerase
MTTTLTGSFPIGFRRGWIDWQKDLGNVISFAKDNGFEAIDVGALPRAELERIAKAGLRIGSIDIMGWTELVSPDAGKRAAAAQKNAEYARGVADLCKNFFTVIIPEDRGKKRQENFAFAVDGYNQLCGELDKVGAGVVIEGYPGGGENIACTPADYRAFFKEVPRAAYVNFDPSHMVRMGIDPVRFLGEFAPKVRHVHGKDTEMFPEEIYEHGWLGPATFAKGHGFGAQFWRYTIPGHGEVRWTRCFELLKQAGYRGIISIELEDERFNDNTAAGEQRGLKAGRDYLQSV